MAAAVAMGLFGMVVAGLQNRGFFRPLHEIAFVVAGDEAVRSLEADLARDPFVVRPEMVIFGAVIHLAVGAFFGALFVLVARRLSSRREVLIAGPIYGLVVMVFMAFIVLPLIALLLDAGSQVTGIPGRTGWLTFAIDHVVYGLVLGWWPWLGVGPE
jgi:hypothetical protein